MKATATVTFEFPDQADDDEAIPVNISVRQVDGALYLLHAQVTLDRRFTVHVPVSLQLKSTPT